MNVKCLGQCCSGCSGSGDKNKTKEKRNINKKTVHPGRVLKEQYLKPFKITVNQLAKRIKVPVNEVEDLINQKIKLDCEMAFRLGRVFNKIPMFWLGLQMDYDILIAKKEKTYWEDIEPFV